MRSIARNVLAGALAARAVGTLTGRLAFAQAVHYDGELRASTGSYYFDRRTSGMVLLTTLGADLGRLGLSASLPVVYQSTPWVTLTAGGSVAAGGPQHGTLADSIRRGRRARRSIALPDTGTLAQSGVGDPSVHARMTFTGATISAVLRAGVKAPVADVSSGLGTGAWDYGAGVGLSRWLGRSLVTLDADYWAIGDMPDLALRDVLSYTASVGRPLAGERWMLFGSLTGSTPQIGGLRAPLALQLSIGRRWSAGTSLSVGGEVGLSPASPDASLSAAWRVPLGGRALP